MYQNKQCDLLSVYSYYIGYLILFPTIYHLHNICRLVQLTEIISKSSTLFKAHSLILWICICLLEKSPFLFLFLFLYFIPGGVGIIFVRENIVLQEV